MKWGNVVSWRGAQDKPFFRLNNPLRELMQESELFDVTEEQIDKNKICELLDLKSSWFLVRG
jgi:hypothetical protein